MGKIELNKKQKADSLLNTAFSLFTSKGFQKTSISDIVKNAGVAKGTFYLYFTDKYDLRNKLIAHKASILFLDACNSLAEKDLHGLENQVIYIADYIIARLEEDKSLLSFISKHLSWGVFRNNLIAYNDGSDQNVYTILSELLHQSGHTYKDPEIMIYMLLETISGAIYNPILHEQPATLDAIRPYIHASIRFLITSHVVEAKENANGS